METMEIHGFPRSKNLGKTNKIERKPGNSKIIEFKFVHFLESRDSGGNGKGNRGAGRRSYQV